MSDLSTRLAPPYLASGQAQMHVTVNETLDALDALICAAARSRSRDATPSAWALTSTATKLDVDGC
jgi:hypothetical protein